MKCHNNNVIVVMGSINQSKSFLARWSLLREFTTGVYHESLLGEVTAGVYRGRFNDLIGCGGDT